MAAQRSDDTNSGQMLRQRVGRKGKEPHRFSRASASLSVSEEDRVARSGYSNGEQVSEEARPGRPPAGTPPEPPSPQPQPPAQLSDAGREEMQAYKQGKQEHNRSPMQPVYAVELGQGCVNSAQAISFIHLRGA